MVLRIVIETEALVPSTGPRTRRAMLAIGHAFTLVTAMATLFSAGSVLAQAGHVAGAPADSVVEAAGTDSVRVVRVLPVTDVTGSTASSRAAPAAASQGTVTAREIALRPSLRAGDFLESVPGLLISQHSGEGKANQYYLRGFNLDHGTDFATSIAGVPMNMPTHAHGQGYTDLNSAIPELIRAVEYQKGTYSVEDGDFSSAGSARVEYRDALPGPLASLSVGDGGYRRALAGLSPAVGSGSLLGAIELEENDGPWVHPDNYRKINGLVRYSLGTAGRSTSITAMGYNGRWNATDQVPERAVASGEISRFGAIDPTDGGTTHRYSLSGEFRDVGPNSLTEATAYLIAYRLDLFSNFTYFLTDTLHGDQIEQYDDRLVAGFHVLHSTSDDRGSGHFVRTIGLDVRHDDIGNVGLYRTESRQRIATVRQDRVQESSASPFVESDATWTPGVRTIIGVRAEGYLFSDASSYAPFSGDGLDGLVSPKASVILGPWEGFELNANTGYGFHSDDVRGASYKSGGAARVAPQVTPDHIPIPGGPLVVRSPLLVRTRGAEVGARCAAGMRGTIAGSLWGLDIDSEHVFLGDQGLSAPSRPSRRTGAEVSADYRPGGGVNMDADMAYSRARFTDQDPAGDYIPGAVEGVLSAGVEYELPTHGFTALRIRYFGPRPLVEDNSVRSHASTVLNGQVGYDTHRRWAIVLQVFNLLDSAVSDVDYYYVSRLRGEPLLGVADVHSHPQGPRSFRLVVSTGSPGVPSDQ